MKKFVQCIQELLLEGKKVKLDGIGTFYLALQTTGAESLGDFSMGNVKGVRLRFLADQGGKSRYTTSVLTRQAKLTSTLPGAEGKENDDDDDDDNSPQQGGGTSGSVEEQP